MTAQTRVGLVGCGAKKLDHAAPARELYTGALFHKAATYAEATCDRWYVLSAEHGLVDPDRVLAPYDTILPARSPEWDELVRAQLADALADVARVLLVALAGERYRTVLHPCQWPYEIPMRGLGIGQQLAWLTERSAA